MLKRFGLNDLDTEGWDLMSHDVYIRYSYAVYRKVIKNIAVIHMKVWPDKVGHTSIENWISFDVWLTLKDRPEFVSGVHSWEEVNELLGNDLKL
jgi:hypothetical protein